MSSGFVGTPPWGKESLSDTVPHPLYQRYQRRRPENTVATYLSKLPPLLVPPKRHSLSWSSSVDPTIHSRTLLEGGVLTHCLPVKLLPFREPILTLSSCFRSKINVRDSDHGRPGPLALGTQRKGGFTKRNEGRPDEPSFLFPSRSRVVVSWRWDAQTYEKGA